MSTNLDKLPSYARSLELFQQVFRDELRELITRLPLKPTFKVLDLACGNGFYTRLLAECVREGEAVGVDISDAYLRLAEKSSADLPPRDRPRFRKGEASKLPFEDDTFDLAWCAHSLISLPDVEAAIAELARVTRPGGWVVILEEDLTHNMILPWPTQLELKVQQAIQQDALKRYGDAEQVSQGRHLGEYLINAGLHSEKRLTHAWDRRAPLSDLERAFLADRLGQLQKRAEPFLDPDTITELRLLFDQAWPAAWSQDDNFELTYLGMVSSAQA